MKSGTTDRKRNMNRLRMGAAVNAIVLCLIICGLVVINGIVTYRLHSVENACATAQEDNESLKNEIAALYTGEDLEKAREEGMLEGKSAGRSEFRNLLKSTCAGGASGLETMRKLFNEDLVVQNGDGYIFLDRDPSVGYHPFGDGDFSAESGRLEYTGIHSDITVEQGTAVSAGNGRISWDKAAEDRLDFVLICAGNIGADGEFEKDGSFRKNLTGAASNGIRAGVYVVLSDPSSENSAAAGETVQSFLDSEQKLTGIQMEEPLFLLVQPDPEDCSTSYMPAVRSFLASLGVYQDSAVVGASTTVMLTQLDVTDIGGSRLLIIEPGDTLYFPYNFRYWQYSDEISVSGIGDGLPGIAGVRYN